MLRDTPVKEIMVTKIVSVHVGNSMNDVEQKLRTNHIRHLPVIDDEGKLVGIITERDLFRAVSPHETEEGFRYDESQLEGLLLEHFMSRKPIVLRPNSPIADAVNVMATLKYGCIPIVSEDGKLVGIITQIDVLRFINRWFNSNN